MTKTVVQAIFDTIKGLIYWIKTVVQGGVKRLTVVQNAERCAKGFAQRYLIDVSIKLQKELRPLCKVVLDRCAVVQRYIYRYTVALRNGHTVNCVKTFGGLV